jgi:hypothetical protein
MDSLSTFDITKYPLLDILKDIKAGRIQLPDFQRDWIWDDLSVRRLLSSISLAYPVGAVMLLQQDSSHMRFKPRLIDGLTLQKPPVPSLLILDGQQRLTTLFMVLLSDQAVLVKDSSSSKISRKWYYLDIEKSLDKNAERIEAIVALPESKSLRMFSGHLIDASTPQQEYLAGLFPLSKVFCFSEWRSQYSRFWEYDTEKLKLIDSLELEVLKKFEHYQMPVIQLRDSLPKEAVCQVFGDANTTGCELNYFDLMSASYCADNFSLRDDWKLRETRLKSFKVLRNLRNTDFLQAITLVTTYNHRRSVLLRSIDDDSEKLPAISCRRRDILKLSNEEYTTWAELVTKGFEEAARFLHSQKFFDANDLAYPIQLVALAAILTVLGERINWGQSRTQLSYWLWSGMFGEMYSRGAETQVARDVQESLYLLLPQPVPTTIECARFSLERLLSVRKRYGAVYQGLSALLRKEGAIDWSTGEEINDVLYFEQRVESHHIFPVSWCRKQGINPKIYNSLVNRTPLSARTNKKIGSKPPSVYLKQLESEGKSPERLDEMLRSHAIEPMMLRSDDFEGFLVSRTQALMKLITRAMGQHLTVEPFEVAREEYENGNGNGHHRIITLND